MKSVLAVRYVVGCSHVCLKKAEATDDSIEVTTSIRAPQQRTAHSAHSTAKMQGPSLEIPLRQCELLPVLANHNALGKSMSMYVRIYYVSEG